MSNKQLSTSTLSLRFMQNAHRAKNLREVEVEKAEVKDDGEWEVSEEVKQAWGMSVIPSQTVTYEASYLPFLFPSESPESSSSWINVKGRRKLKSGKEVVEEAPQDRMTHPEADDTHVQEDISHSSKRPVSISSIVASRSKKTKNPTKTAQEMIYSNSGVGTDLRPPRSEPPLPDTISLQSGFLKPSGVDDPAGPKESTRPSDQGVIFDKGSSNTAAKRRRDLASDPSHLESKKHKKKKTGTATE